MSSYFWVEYVSNMIIDVYNIPFDDCYILREATGGEITR